MAECSLALAQSIDLMAADYSETSGLVSLCVLGHQPSVQQNTVQLSCIRPKLNIRCIPFSFRIYVSNYVLCWTLGAQLHWQPCHHTASVRFREEAVCFWSWARVFFSLLDISEVKEHEWVSGYSEFSAFVKVFSLWRTWMMIHQPPEVFCAWLDTFKALFLYYKSNSHNIKNNKQSTPCPWNIWPQLSKYILSLKYGGSTDHRGIITYPFLDSGVPRVPSN